MVVLSYWRKVIGQKVKGFRQAYNRPHMAYDMLHPPLERRLTMSDLRGVDNNRIEWCRR